MSERLCAQSVLQRQPNLLLRLMPDAMIEVELEDGWVTVHPTALAILDVFSVPRTIKEGLERLQRSVDGNQDWIDMSQNVFQMASLGILARPGKVRQARTTRVFDQAPAHIAMLDDEVRTSSYLEAIRRTVRPGDVVVDLGTGTGVLATAAAFAGARRVFAVEAGQIGLQAEKVFAINGVADRVELVRGWSTKVELPEKADLMVSELLGTNPFGEKILEFTLDCRRRFLKPGARQIPCRLKVSASLVAGARGQLRRGVFLAEAIADWNEHYKIDFSPLLDSTPALSRFTVFPENCDFSDKAPETILVDLDLTSFTDTVVETNASLKAGQQGPYDGILLAFEVELAQGISLSTHPARAGPTCHWGNHLWVLGKEPVPAGKELAVRYRYGRTGPLLELQRASG